MIASLLLATTSIPFVEGASVIYNGFNWESDFCSDIVTQPQIDGEEYPNAQVDFIIRPSSTNHCLRIDKNINCVTNATGGIDNPCWYEGSFNLDYQSIVLITSPDVNANNSIISEAGEDGGNGLAWNTSATHLANNQAALTWDWADSYRSFHYGDAVLGQVVPCEGYFNINADSEYSFIMQMRNTSTIDIWLGNSTYPFVRWCSMTDLTGGFIGYEDGFFVIGMAKVVTSGGWSGTMLEKIRGIVQGFGCIGDVVHQVFVSQVNLDCDAPTGVPPIEIQIPGAPEPIEAPPAAFGEGNQTTFSILLVEDDRGNLRSQYAEGESMIFDASLQFINDTTGLVQDVPEGL